MQEGMDEAWGNKKRSGRERGLRGNVLRYNMIAIKSVRDEEYTRKRVERGKERQRAERWDMEDGVEGRKKRKIRCICMKSEVCVKHTSFG
jgi:hypothetical protein